MRKIGLISLALAASLLPSTMFAGRLDGDFSTQDSVAAVDTNDACIEVNDTSYDVFGRVTGISGDCTVRIDYFTPQPHKASATALKGTKTQGSAKVDQTIFSDVDISVIDTDGLAPLCTTVFVGSVNEDVEKCKATASMKGTVVDPGADTVQSANVSATCELGEAGANVDVDPVTAGVQPPSTEQIDVVVAAFDGRKDVRLDSKGKLAIKQKGVPDASEVPFCD